MDNFFHHQPQPESWWRQSIAYTLEIIKVFLIALAIVVPIRYFLIQPFYVKGASMEPNFYDHEYLIIDEISYRLREPQRGEVVVFKYPRNPRQFYIKRIVGLPGENIQVKDGAVYITATDGQQYMYEEDYLDPGLVTQAYNYSDVTLGTEQYFLLGDNRSASYDSRHFGVVTREFLVGRAILRVLPFSRINWLAVE